MGTFERNTRASFYLFSLSITAALFAALCGCAGPQGRSRNPSAAKAASSKSVTSAAAQKGAYDRGMKFYTQEKYKEARKAWQEAVRLGPSTTIGQQAQNYLKNVEQVIKTLEGIQTQ